MKYNIFYLLLILLVLTSCFNQAKVPDKIETCIKDTKTGECTNEMRVTHTIIIELPVALVNDCQDKYKDLEEPDKTLQTEACMTAYIKTLLDLINGITPEDVTAP